MLLPWLFPSLERLLEFTGYVIPGELPAIFNAISVIVGFAMVVYGRIAARKVVTHLI